MPNIRPYNGEPYSVFPWGSAGYIDGYACPADGNPAKKNAIAVRYATNHRYDVLMYLRYSVFNRYKNTEYTIEDIYSNITSRALALGCMDGPLFAFNSRIESEE